MERKEEWTGQPLLIDPNVALFVEVNGEFCSLSLFFFLSLSQIEREREKNSLVSFSSGQLNEYKVARGVRKVRVTGLREMEREKVKKKKKSTMDKKYHL